MNSFSTNTDIMKGCVALYGRHRMKITAFDVGFVEFCETCGEGEWTNTKVRGLHRKVSKR